MALIGLVNKQDENWLKKQPVASSITRYFQRVSDFIYYCHSRPDKARLITAVICSDTLFSDLYSSLPASSSHREILSGRVIVLRSCHKTEDFEQDLDISGLVAGWIDSPYDTERFNSLLNGIDQMRDPQVRAWGKELLEHRRKSRLQSRCIKRLRELKRIIENTGDFSEICRILVESACEVSDSETGMIVAPGNKTVFFSHTETGKIEVALPESLLINSALPFNHVIVNRIVFLQQPYRLSQPSEFIENFPELRCMAAVPIIENENSVGVLAVGNSSNGEYDSITIESLKQIAEIGSLALERYYARNQLEKAGNELNQAYEDLNLTYQDLQNHVVIVDQLQSIERRIQAATDIRFILRELVEGAHHLLGCEFCLIAFRESSEQKYSYHINNEICQFLLESSETFPLSSIRLFNDPSNIGESYLDNNPPDALVRALRPFRVELRSILAVPLANENQVLGFLIGINKKGEEFGSNDRFLIRAMAGTAITAIMNSSLVRRFKGLFEHSVKALANAIEARDNYTRGHTDRVSSYVQAMCRELGWDRAALEQAYIGTLLHDIGKIGVPDAILSKPSRLTEEEYAAMKQHVLIGEKIVRDVPQLEVIGSYIRCHHERFDGYGYPDRLSANTIPAAGRITAVADSFDAMTSDRPYRRAMTTDQAIEELRKNAGTQFDPEMVEVFIYLLESGAFERELRHARNMTEERLVLDTFINTSDLTAIG